jgi:hypothetical protein
MAPSYFEVAESEDFNELMTRPAHTMNNAEDHRHSSEGDGVDEDDEDDDYEVDDPIDDEQPVELPSYRSHVLDRLADAEIGCPGSDGLALYPPNLLAGPASIDPGTPPWHQIGGESSLGNPSGDVTAQPRSSLSSSFHLGNAPNIITIAGMGSSGPGHSTPESHPSSPRCRQSGGEPFASGY